MRSCVRKAFQTASIPALVLSIVLAPGCGSGQPSMDSQPSLSVASQGTIEGTATYRERMAMPPNAVFEAVLQDVSIADAPAIEIARQAIEKPPQVPLAFTITYDSATIDAARTYSVRARILVDGRPWFASDQAYPVLTRGAGRSVQILLRRVSSIDGGGAAGATLMGGEMIYMADAARLTECLGGQSYPIAMEGEFTRMQRVYLQKVSAPGARLYVTFEGAIVDRPRMEGGGNERTVVVTSFIDAWPSQNCDRSRANAPLVNSYWRITQLDGNPVTVASGRRQPHVILREAGGKQTYSATVGCNGIAGDVAVTNDQIAFGPGRATMMSCGPELDALERQLGVMLGKAKRWRVFGNTLEFRDEAGMRLALFEATPMR
jgi:uncharacterized lipoprotein YbaY/heat shock protein HslJ